jgi:hypothetical protein
VVAKKTVDNGVFIVAILKFNFPVRLAASTASQVSSLAQLPTPGQLEFEDGALSTRSDGDRRDSLPVLFKLAFSEQWGLLVGGDAYVAARDGDGARTRGFGDTNLILKRAFVVDSATAFGLELNAKMPTARNGIGSGSADYEMNTIFSKDIGKVHMDANANLTGGRLLADCG